MISMIRKITPDKIRIPIYVIVIAAFVSIVDMVMAAYLPDLHKALGLFIPLIVVNCIIMGRAEAFASKNSVMDSMADGIGMGLGFTLALTLMSSIREILGSGTWAGMKVMPATYDPMLIAILTPGAFITLGLLMAGINMLKEKFL